MGLLPYLRRLASCMTAAAAGGTLVWTCWPSHYELPVKASSVATVAVVDTEKRPKEVGRSNPRSRKAAESLRNRFQECASLSLAGSSEYFMTALDFLQAINDLPCTNRAVTDSVIVNSSDLRRLTDYPLQQKGSLSWLFSSKDRDFSLRQMGNNGVFTYADFVLLLCSITQSERGFRLAFQLVDRDQNGTIELGEFKRLSDLVNAGVTLSSDDPIVDHTTMTSYLFGTNGKSRLSYKAFKSFLEAIWRDTVQFEFESHAAKATLSDGTSHLVLPAAELAKILVRNTNLDSADRKKLFSRLQRRAPKMTLSLDDFIKFNEFLKYLEEFRLSMHIYDMARAAVEPDDLSKAIFVASGIRMPSHVIELLYAIFDVNGDGKLSQREFVKILADRLHRGLAVNDPNKSNSGTTEEEGFLARWHKCIKHEMSAPS